MAINIPTLIIYLIPRLSENLDVKESRMWPIIWQVRFEGGEGSPKPSPKHVTGSGGTLQ